MTDPRRPPRPAPPARSRFVASGLVASGLILAGLVVLGFLPAGPAAADPGRLELGKRVFTGIAEPRCGICHTLADAGTTGEVGPVLDALKPDAVRVSAAVTNGIGVMPAFEDLTPGQVEAVALYVATVTGGAK